MTRPVVPTFAHFSRVFSVYALSAAIVAVLSVGAVTAFCHPKLLGAMAATFLVGVGAGRMNIKSGTSAWRNVADCQPECLQYCKRA